MAEGYINDRVTLSAELDGITMPEINMDELYSNNGTLPSAPSLKLESPQHKALRLAKNPRWVTREISRLAGHVSGLGSLPEVAALEKVIVNGDESAVSALSCIVANTSFDPETGDLHIPSGIAMDDLFFAHAAFLTAAGYPVAQAWGVEG